LPPTADRTEPTLLFVYGTLAPANSALALATGWAADRVRGRLFDLGPYPALVDWDDPEAGWIDGYVRRVDRRELEERLDPYEGVAEGLYRRLPVMTAAGRLAWVYVYPHPLPQGARGPLERWRCSGQTEPS
jgi:gamma-glutamylcyclotransferase (GGCT)/AIG2-like uncharacterized protein YtfP